MNGLAMEQGSPRYVTAVSRSDVADGWRDRIVGRWFPSGFIQRLPTHAPGVEADEDQDVEKWTEDKVQHGHEEDGIVDYPDVKHVLEWQKND